MTSHSRVIESVFHFALSFELRGHSLCRQHQGKYDPEKAPESEQAKCAYSFRVKKMPIGRIAIENWKWLIDGDFWALTSKHQPAASTSLHPTSTSVTSLGNHQQPNFWIIKPLTPSQLYRAKAQADWLDQSFRGGVFGASIAFRKDLTCKEIQRVNWIELKLNFELETNN